MNLPWLSALLTIASCKPGMGTTHVGIKWASWWTGMGSAIIIVILQFNFVSLQWTWKTIHVNMKRNEEVLHPLLFVKFSPIKIPFKVYTDGILPTSFTGCKIKSSCESIMQKRIHVNDHQTIEFLSTDWGFVCFKILAEIVNSYY